MLATGKGESRWTQHPSSHLGLPRRAPVAVAVLNPAECHREEAGMWHVPACDNRGRERVERRCK